MLIYNRTGGRILAPSPFRFTLLGYAPAGCKVFVFLCGAVHFYHPFVFDLGEILTEINLVDWIAILILEDIGYGELRL